MYISEMERQFSSHMITTDVFILFYSGWLNYANYKQYYDIAKANYESVAIPDANVNLYKKEFGENRGQFFDRQALAFSENNGYRMSVSDYMSRIYNRYVTAMNK